MLVEDTPEAGIDGKLSEKPFMECRKSSLVEGTAEGVGSLKNEKCLNSLDLEPYSGPEGGSSGADSKLFENSFRSGSQNGTIHEGSKDPGVGWYVSGSSKSHRSGNCLQSSQAEGVSGELDCVRRDREIFQGVMEPQNKKDRNKSGKSLDSAPRSGESCLTSSSEAVEEKTKDEVVINGEFDSDGKSFEDKLSDDGSNRNRETQQRSPRTESGRKNGENREKLWIREPEDKKVFECTASDEYGMNGNPRENLSVGGAGFYSSQAGGCLESESSEVHRNGETTHRTSDVGASFDGKFSENSFSCLSRHEEQHHRHSRGSGGGLPNPALVERLYNPPHICNHVRCAANNPDYAAKQAVPPKKYLVSKKHQYGGANDKSRRTSCDHDGHFTEKSRRVCCDHDGGSTEKSRRASCDYDGESSEKSRTTSCDHDKSSNLHGLTNNGRNRNMSRRASADSNSTRAIDTPAGKARRTSVDSDRKHAHSSSGAPHHRRGNSTPPVGFTPEGPWNPSVAVDKKRRDQGFWSSTKVDKKHGDHGGWNSSVAVDKKQGDYYYGPWNGSVAIEKKIGDRKDKPRSNLPGAARHSSTGDLLHSSRRTSTESSITEDRRQKPRRSSIASEAAEAIETPNCRRMSGRAEKTNGSATASVSGLSEEGRSPPRSTTPQVAGVDGSPSASVGSNHTDNSSSKDAVSWQQSRNSPESSCVTGGDSPSCESLSSVTRGADSKAASRARYELPTMSSKLPKFNSALSSSQSLSVSTNGISSLSKPSWNSSTSKVSLNTATLPTVASVANTSRLTRNFITKLKESTKTVAPAAVAKAQALPLWNSSITVVPSLFNCSTNGTGGSKTARKHEAKQSNKVRKAVRGAEEQVDDNSNSDNPTPPKDAASTSSKGTGATGSTVAKEMSVPIPESSAEKHVDPGSVVSIPSSPSSKLTRYGSMRDSTTNNTTRTKLSKILSSKEKEIKVPGTLTFGKRGRTTWIEDARKNETVNLKKGETAERRLSEEYMTDHTLATTIPRDIQGGRVKSLVHAFESLKTGPDAEHHHSADETVRSEYERELAALPPSPSQIPA